MFVIGDQSNQEQLHVLFTSDQPTTSGGEVPQPSDFEKKKKSTCMEKVLYATSVQDFENPWRGLLIIPMTDLKYQLRTAHNHHRELQFQWHHPMFLYNLKKKHTHKVKAD
jgi:hypothetical protein